MDENKSAYLYIIPLSIMFVVIVIYPILFNTALSFYEWNGFSNEIFKKFNGIQNYIKLAKDEYFWVALRNTGYFILANSIFQVLLSLVFAVVLYYGSFKYENIIKGIFFFPALLSPVVVGLVWKYLLSYQGPINNFLSTIGLDFLAIEWLGNIYTPIWVVSFINIWRWVGYGFVLFYAGLTSISNELIEAARIDGATFFQYIAKIVIPLLKQIIILDLLLVFISSFRIFDIVYVTTRGGPVHQSEILTTLQYYYSFDSYGPNEMGVASAISVVLLIFVVVFSIIRLKVSARVVTKKDI